ncbi:MAG: hypothetical protein ACT4PP_13550 [Sporichthyaceae bacterium]
MRLRNAPLALGVALLGVGSWVLLPMGAAGAESSYDALARSDASTITIANQSIPTGIDIEGGGPVAQVRQDSVGIADASAQFPYAGDTFPGLPGLGASLFGFPAPPYPLIASSTAGSPPQNTSYPGVTLQAESGDFSTFASAVGGSPGAGVSATARVDEARLGDVTSTASTTTDTIKLGPYGTLSNVRTVATVVANGSTGKLTRNTTSSIGRISVPGLVFTVPDQSPTAIPIPIPIPGVPNQPPIEAPPFPFPGAGMTFSDPDLGIQDGFFVVTVPGSEGQQKYVVPAEPVLQGLAAQGVTLAFQAPQKTATGIIAGAYIVSYTIPAPPPNSYYTGPTTITQTTAYALSSVNLQPIVVPAGLAPETASVADLPQTAEIEAGAPVPADLLPGTAVAPGAALATVDLAVPGANGDTVALAGFRVGEGVDNLYLAVAGLALAALLAAGAVSALGVRSS